MRVVLLCRYDGSGYHGFQIQPNNNTVQEEIEKALKIKEAYYADKQSSNKRL